MKNPPSPLHSSFLALYFYPGDTPQLSLKSVVILYSFLCHMVPFLPSWISHRNLYFRPASSHVCIPFTVDLLVRNFQCLSDNSLFYLHFWWWSFFCFQYSEDIVLSLHSWDKTNLVTKHCSFYILAGFSLEIFMDYSYWHLELTIYKDKSNSSVLN